LRIKNFFFKKIIAYRHVKLCLSFSCYGEQRFLCILHDEMCRIFITTKCNKMCLAAGLRPDPLEEFTALPASPRWIKETKKAGKGIGRKGVNGKGREMGNKGEREEKWKDKPRYKIVRTLLGQ